MSHVCHLYVTRIYSYVICMSLVRARILSICTRMPVLCHSYILICNGMSLICTSMSSVCHSYVLVCHTYVTRMYSFVICMSLVYTRMQSQTSLKLTKFTQEL